MNPHKDVNPAKNIPLTAIGALANVAKTSALLVVLLVWLVI
jgi:hypothetical protein